MERGWNRIICGEVCARAHLVAQSCPTLYDPRDCSLPGSSICGILQARILEWLAKPFSRESSQPRDRTQVSRTVGRFFTGWATREARVVKQMQPNVIVKPRLQVCVFIMHSFRRTSWRWRTERPKKRTYHILPWQCHVRIWCSELRPIVGLWVKNKRTTETPTQRSDIAESLWGTELCPPQIHRLKP